MLRLPQIINMSNNKVLFIITSPAAGGSETYLIRFLEYAKEIDSIVLCKKSIHGELEDRYMKVCQLLYIGNLGFLNPIPYFRLIRKLKQLDITAICDFTGNFSAWDLLCAKMSGVGNRIVFYRESRNQFKLTLFKCIYAWVLTCITQSVSTKILSNSFEALKHFHPNWEKTPNRYEVIYNGLDMTKLSKKTKREMRLILNIPQDVFVICHSGRYTEAKNHSMIMQCAIRLCRKYSDIYFILMGRGVKERYSDTIQEKQISENVRLLGYRSDVLDVLKCADLFYFPSLNEGQPNSLIEAMASDLPFIASDIPSIRETVPEEYQNRLVDPYSLEKNYEALEKAYLEKDTMQMQNCGEWARKKYEALTLFNQFKRQIL